MSLPAKNRRRLQLDCGKFRYIFSPDMTNNRGRLVIERANGLGSMLIVQWRGLLPDKPKVVPRRHMKTAILFAIENGWTNSCEKQFEVGCDTTGEKAELIVRPNNVPNDWFSGFQFDNSNENDHDS